MVGALLGHALGETAWPLAIAVLIAGGISVLLWWFSRGVRSYGTCSSLTPAEQPVDQPVVDAALPRPGGPGASAGDAVAGCTRAGGTKPAVMKPPPAPGKAATGTP